MTSLVNSPKHLRKDNTNVPQTWSILEVVIITINMIFMSPSSVFSIFLKTKRTELFIVFLQKPEFRGRLLCKSYLYLCSFDLEWHMVFAKHSALLSPLTLILSNLFTQNQLFLWNLSRRSAKHEKISGSYHAWFSGDLTITTKTLFTCFFMSFA